MIRILYVYGMDHTRDIVYNLRNAGYMVSEYRLGRDNSILDEADINQLTAYIEENHITYLMSVHLIYNVAVAAYRSGIKYVSLIWDAPYIKIYTPFGKLNNCWYSVFDKLDCKRLSAAGIPHVLYQPLSVNQDNIRRWNAKEKLNGKYINEISFVGSLYEDNLYDQYLKEIPLKLQGYFTSIFEEAAFCWDGRNRIYGKTAKEILDYIRMVNSDFVLDNVYDIDDVQYFETQYLIRKIANIERICVLNLLGEQFPVTLYTYSRIDTSKLENVTVMPPVEYGEASAIIFAGSKINLNISLRGIEGGTPQRIMDIMGAGGFVITNYCKETAELFEEDKELVMFRTPEELMEKAAYYLAHDGKREKIAAAGQRKVLQCYTYDKKLKQLMEWVEEEE